MNRNETIIDVEETSVNLKKIRMDRGLKVGDVQDFFGMENPQTIYYWESRKHKTLPTLDHLILLARLYGTTLDELVIVKDL